MTTRAALRSLAASVAMYAAGAVAVLWGRQWREW